jgi:chromosome segregation ATPase
VQYDNVIEGSSFVRDPSELTRYDGDAVRMQLALRHRGVEALEASTAEARSALDATQSALNSASRDVQRAREDSRQLRDVVAAQNAAIELRDAQLADARAAIAALGDEINARERDVGQLRATIAQQRDALAAAETEATVRDRELASHVRELAATRTGLADVRARLDQTHRSWSWRITNPARVLLRWVRGY